MRNPQLVLRETGSAAGSRRTSSDRRPLPPVRASARSLPRLRMRVDPPNWACPADDATLFGAFVDDAVRPASTVREFPSADVLRRSRASRVRFDDRLRVSAADYWRRTTAGEPPTAGSLDEVRRVVPALDASRVSRAHVSSPASRLRAVPRCGFMTTCRGRKLGRHLGLVGKTVEPGAEAPRVHSATRPARRRPGPGVSHAAPSATRGRRASIKPRLLGQRNVERDDFRLSNSSRVDGTGSLSVVRLV